MNVLLDTHTLIWFFDGAPMLSGPARAAVEDEGNRLYLSAASFIEMGIKISLGGADLCSQSLKIERRSSGLPEQRSQTPAALGLVPAYLLLAQDIGKTDTKRRTRNADKGIGMFTCLVAARMLLEATAAL